ncbi:MFS transporter [Streptomyces sp. NPDC096142]|uniref:MFS transporter n=1 Tax=Streptomyces sp. NPDC096142 TaxID=3366077 RepID=UPI00382DEA52
MPHPTAPATEGLPALVWVLTAGTFLMGTTEMVIAGILPDLASDLDVSVSHAGLLVTAFAVGIIVGSPTMALITLHLPQRRTLVLALAVFAAGHVIAALTSSFAVALAARLLTALAAGAFWSVGFVMATAAAGPDRATRAVSVMMGGLSVATVIGVPAASLAGHVTSWRGVFWTLAALAVLVAVVIHRVVPGGEQRARVSVRSEIQALRQGRLWLSLAAAALIMGGVLATYSYITPLLTGRTKIPTSAVPLVLALFGAGALGGNMIGGRYGGHRPLRTAIPAAGATALTLLALVPLASSPAAAVILIFATALAGYTVNPIVTTLTMRYADAAPTLASALSTSSYNVGIASGSALAGQALTSPLGLNGPAVTGAALTALTLLPLTALALTRTSR